MRPRATCHIIRSRSLPAVDNNHVRIEPYERQISWRKAMKLAATIYHITQDFPQEEKSGLTAAVRRLAASIPGKLADAHGHVNADTAIKSFEATQATLRELQSTLQIASMLHMLSSFRLHRLRSQCQKIDDLIEDSIDTCRAHQEEAEKQTSQAAA